MNLLRFDVVGICRRGVIIVMALLIVGMSSASAGLIGTDSVLVRQPDADRAAVLALLDRADVRDQLVALGVDPAEAVRRVEAMTAAELRELAHHMDQQPAGAGIVSAAVTVFVVLLITDILGFTDVFPFVRRTVR